jgi:hypothetical protein
MGAKKPPVKKPTPKPKPVTPRPSTKTYYA